MTSSHSTENNYKGWSGIKRAFATPSALTLFCLGLGSGLPFLLVGGMTLSTWLRDVGFELSVIGLISFVGFFYVLKFLWAPLIDKYSLPFLGRRKGWLVLSQIVLIATLSAIALLGPESSLGVFIVLVGVAAFAGATLDTVVDAYRIEIAPIEFQAALASTYILGYRIALILSGAVAFYIADLWGWKNAYLMMALFMVIPLLATLMSKEPATPQTIIVRDVHIVDAFIKPFQEFFSRNGMMLALALLLFVGLFRLPDQMIGVMAGPFYLDSGYTKTDIATVSKLFGVWVGIAGAFLGGICVAIFSMRSMLFVATIVVSVSNIAYLLMANNPGQDWAFFAAISADNISQGFAGVVLVAFMSGLTNQNFTATQYALLASLANLPGKFIGGLSGYIVEASSYSWFYIFSSLSVIPTLLILAWLWNRLHKTSA
ncbi:MFS transporter [Cellvibrio sp. pealriver]|uniref:AmpG family muropeptide MFS transporter n=1 Tax=Cellvibrio sp. pealriver TaxID=1622269 RepID=UPI00066FDAB8|nr:MFS transporter [Cellvibrio sp. pealriver]